LPMCRMSSPPLAAVALLSAAALAYEVLLMRLFSIILWHHFAYMIISVAMLGYGAAGAFVALMQRQLLPRFERVFVAAAAGFGVTSPAGALQWIGALGLVAAALAAQRLRVRPRWLPAALLGGAAVLAINSPSQWAALHPSAYKDLSQTLAIRDTRVVAERSSPM